ncbi:mechanosensitive ion channel [Bacillus altitudinis]|jgi:small-conductance mechanosensitive channel|uniref:mechanosensitive ion channel family protein n=1 Tax=Bacillus TaxID=1386 RepID=UPI00042F3844|nr:MULTISPECIES: mechanosensitive ion channel domain-containing protein [Bacillus]AHL70613.1 mechanosensitive ion channel protein MscS [Bacillus pumilus]KML01638.1 mechanosensitive ion channel protein MscS [Bacillus stratosphericus]MBW3701740.1 mechanosensitive ion channel protein MscS [Bacillus aerophilus]CVN62313.1 mechanosensitive ion channel protein [Streptococcus pneumoniae]AMB89042.1 mechanosensitive ion channel protein MscS [Bacillus altitudinis]
MDETFLTVVKNKYIEILLVGLILWLAVFMINKALQIFFKRTEFIEDKKKKTIESLVKSVSKYTASICFVLYVISLFFHDFGKILAGAGVAGIVIGFGAQTLIRDILAGIFLIYERQIHKGDYVTVNNLFNGTIEEIGLRSLQIREWSGKLLTISNGDIRQIQNYNMHYMRITESVLISANQNPDIAFKALETACDQLNQMHHDLLKKDEFQNAIEPFQVHGIMGLNKLNRGIEITVKGMVEDEKYFEAALAVRKEMITQLHQHDVKLLEDLVYPQPAK